MKKKENFWLSLRQIWAPEECSDPVHFRKFINFFETGRAQNFNEARNLFDEYIHRVKMEQLAANQVSASLSAAAAASAAASASLRAASAAEDARDAANRADMNSRYK